MKLVLVVLFIGLGSLSWGAEDFPVRDGVFQFLDKNVMGKSQKLSAQGTLTSDGSSYLVSFEATIKWEGLQKTPEGLVFDETRIIKQTSTKTDPKGKPIGEAIDTSRTVKLHHALAERDTANLLVGQSTMVENTLEDPTGKGFATMIQLSDDKRELYLYESMTGFVEASLDGKTVIPVATASADTFSLDNNKKLQTAETLKFYKVDVNKDFARTEINRFNLLAIEVTP